MTKAELNNHDDSDDEEIEELSEQIEKVQIDASKLTPLSPEVISKQVRATLSFNISIFNTHSPPQATINLGK